MAQHAVRAAGLFPTSGLNDALMAQRWNQVSEEPEMSRAESTGLNLTVGEAQREQFANLTTAAVTGERSLLPCEGGAVCPASTVVYGLPRRKPQNRLELPIEWTSGSTDGRDGAPADMSNSMVIWASPDRRRRTMLRLSKCSHLSIWCGGAVVACILSLLLPPGVRGEA
jgi:hypothetical protein